MVSFHTKYLSIKEIRRLFSVMLMLLTNDRQKKGKASHSA